MTHRPAQNLPDLTEAWPTEEGNDDLARLGQDLLAAHPALPQLALDRIQVQMRREINRVERARKWRRLVLTLLTCIALAVGLWALMHPRKTNPPIGNGPTTDQPAIRDRFDVTLPPPSPKPSAKPLVDLDRYQDLFGTRNKETHR